MSKKNKSKLLINLEYSLLLLIRMIITIIPLQMAYFLGKIIVSIVFTFDKRHKTRTIQHILHSGIKKTPKDAKILAKKTFLHLSQVLVESFNINSYITSENINEKVSLIASDKVKKQFFNKDKPNNAILVSAHFGNWEFAGIVYSLLSNNLTTSIMRPFDNPKIGELFYKGRIKYKHKLCPKSGAIRPMLTALRKNESIGVISDQHANHIDGVETTFFDQPARTHASVALLHLKTKTPIIVSVLKRLDNNMNFALCCSEPINYVATDDKNYDIAQITQLYTTELEKIIRETPEQWMWTHRRWLNINRKNG